MIEEWIIIPITREHSDEKNAANINWNFRNNGSTQERPPLTRYLSRVASTGAGSVFNLRWLV